MHNLCGAQSPSFPNRNPLQTTRSSCIFLKLSELLSMLDHKLIILWVIVIGISGCLSKQKLGSADFSLRQPASTEHLIEGSQAIIKDLQDEKVFNSQTCDAYIENLTSSLFHLPSDYFFPKNESEKELLRIKGPELIQTFFDARELLQSKLKDFDRDQKLSPGCLNAIREGNQYLRYAEDFMLEWLTENKLVPAESPVTLAPSYPHTVWSKKFEGYQIQAGDVLVIRGKSYVSAMIARIGDEEGTFSHLAMVASDAKGRLYLAESLIQKGLVLTPLDEWRKNKDVRVALYRHPSGEIAKQASRAIYDHAMSFIKKGTTKRYDFAMDDEDSSAFFCSEVVQWAYAKVTDGELKLPKFRSHATKFAGTQYFKSLGIKEGTLFAPFDMEVDPRFEFVAEYRYLPYLRQVRMQDAVLQSVYDWIINKKYDFKPAPGIATKAGLVKLARQFGLAKEHLPTYMPFSTLVTNLKYQAVATTLEQNIYKIEADYYKKNGHSMSFKEMMSEHDRLRVKDCIAEKQFQSEPVQDYESPKPSTFHWFFRGNLNSCE